MARGVGYLQRDVYGGMFMAGYGLCWRHLCHTMLNRFCVVHVAVHAREEPQDHIPVITRTHVS